MLRMPINRAASSRFVGACVFAGAVFLLAGCVENGDRATGASASTPLVQTVPIPPGPGVPMEPEVASVSPESLSENKKFSYRSDPYALSPIEVRFDLAQYAESFLMEMDWGTPGDLSLDQVSGVVRPVIVPVPRWRLSGIIIANGVLGLLDMGGKTITIRPGMRIPDTEWTVVSIDTQRAILRRDENRRPSEFAVNLAGSLPDSLPDLRGGGDGGRGGRGGPGLAPP